MAFNPQMLTLARELASMSQSELALRSKINQSVISKYESGIYDPAEKHVEILAEVLDVPVAFLGLPETRFKFGSSCTYHRKQQSASVSQLTQILAEVNLLRIVASRIVAGVEIHTESEIPRLDIEDYDGDVLAIAGFTRQQMLVPQGPIRNLVELLESSGAIVVARHFWTRKLDAVSQWPTASAPPVFLVNADAPVDRQRYNLAHELGHLVMHRVPTNDMEREADVFAAEFLMPKEDIAEELEGLQMARLHSLKLRWRTSMASLVRRARDLGKITDYQYKNFYVKLSQAGYRVREPDVLESETPKLLGAILKAYQDDMGYSNSDLCKLLCINPRKLYTDYGIGSPPSLRFA